MKKLILLFVVLPTIVLKAQTWSFELSYKYLYSKQWDKAIQTYNFSRPFLTNPQPLLMNGCSASINYLFKSDKKIKRGVSIEYSYIRSEAKNGNLKNVLNLHFLNAGYLLHFEDLFNKHGFFSDIILSATSSALYKRINDLPFVYDYSKAKALGIGAQLNIKLGYKFESNKKANWAPFINLGYTPYLYSPNSESILNQTLGLTSNYWTSLYTFQAGVSIHLKKHSLQLL